MKGIELPIFFIDSNGQETHDRVLGSPCIRVSVGYGTDVFKGASFPAVHTWGLLDTGADHCYVDSSILRDTGAPRLRPIAANGAPTFVHRAHLTITDAPFSFVDQEVAARDIAGEGQGFRVILGRVFFQWASLTFDIGVGQAPRLVFHVSLERS